MTGSALYAYLRRLVKLVGVTVQNGSEVEAELYDCLTEGRDNLQQLLARHAPVVVKQLVTLEAVAGVEGRYQFPAGVGDPVRVFVVKEPGDEAPLTPAPGEAGMLEETEGTYEWLSPRILQLRSDLVVSGLEVVAICQQAAITSTTTEAQVGLPVPCHRAIGKWAALAYLSRDEDLDPTNAAKQLETELQRLMGLYGSFDAQGGEALRHAMLASISGWQGEYLF